MSEAKLKRCKAADAILAQQLGLYCPNGRAAFIRAHGWEAYLADDVESPGVLRSWLAEQRACGALDAPTLLPYSRQVLARRKRAGIALEADMSMHARGMRGEEARERASSNDAGSHRRRRQPKGGAV